MNSQIGILDILNIMSFYIGLLNLDENLNQGDKQDLIQEFSKKAELLLREIHKHLEEQDEKLNKILEVLNDNGRSL